MVNWNYRKGASFEYETMYYFLYHGFDNIRSYASKGVADVRAVPPRHAKLRLAIAIQCKNTKNGDYITPKERATLKLFSSKYSYIVIEVFKKDRKAWIKLQPWNLKGKIITPDEFLKTYYGLEADTWADWRKNWFKNKIKRKVYKKNNI